MKWKQIGAMMLVTTLTVTSASYAWANEVATVSEKAETVSVTKKVENPQEIGLPPIPEDYPYDNLKGLYKAYENAQHPKAKAAIKLKVEYLIAKYEAMKDYKDDDKEYVEDVKEESEEALEEQKEREEEALEEEQELKEQEEEALEEQKEREKEELEEQKEREEKALEEQQELKEQEEEALEEQKEREKEELEEQKEREEEALEEQNKNQ